MSGLAKKRIPPGGHPAKSAPFEGFLAEASVRDKKPREDFRLPALMKPREDAMLPPWPAESA